MDHDPARTTAATILLVRDDPFEVLMVRRHKEQFFSSALGVPGGTVGPSDRADSWADLIVDEAAGETSILFPTRMNISRLAEHDDVAGAIAAARARPVFDVEPRMETRAGRMAVMIPANAGYSGTEHFHPHGDIAR